MCWWKKACMCVCEVMVMCICCIFYRVGHAAFIEGRGNQGGWPRWKGRYCFDYFSKDFWYLISDILHQIIFLAFREKGGEAKKCHQMAPWKNVQLARRFRRSGMHHKKIKNRFPPTPRSTHQKLWAVCVDVLVYARFDWQPQKLKENCCRWPCTTLIRKSALARQTFLMTTAE